MRRERETPHVGVLRGSFEELHAAGCIQTGADIHDNVDNARARFSSLFAGLMLMTNRNICDGYPAYKNGACPCFQKYHTQAISNNATRPPGTDQHPGLSVGQIAEKLGISKAEVRRRKIAGTI